MSKSVHHVVRRPGRRHEDQEIEIPVADDLVSVPGSPIREEDVAFYSREYPLESQNVEKAADREWVWTVYTVDVAKYRKGHDDRSKPLVQAAKISGEIKPTGKPTGKDVTEDIRSKARELGFGEVGFTKYDRQYTYVSKKRWALYEHAICLALESLA